MMHATLISLLLSSAISAEAASAAPAQTGAQAGPSIAEQDRFAKREWKSVLVQRPNADRRWDGAVAPAEQVNGLEPPPLPLDPVALAPLTPSQMQAVSPGYLQQEGAGTKPPAQCPAPRGAQPVAPALPPAAVESSLPPADAPEAELTGERMIMSKPPIFRRDHSVAQPSSRISLADTGSSLEPTSEIASDDAPAAVAAEEPQDDPFQQPRVMPKPPQFRHGFYEANEPSYSTEPSSWHGTEDHDDRST